MKQKYLFILIALLAAFSAKADDYFSSDGFSFSITGDNEVTVSRGPSSGDLVIPETVTYEGVTYTVTAIGEQAFMNCSNLTSVTIPSSITSIKHDAFYRCSGLITVKIENAPTSIDSQAFAWCYNLTNMDLGNAVTSIGRAAFAYCYKMMDVEIPNTVTSIGKYAFDVCSGMTKLRIPASVSFIDEEAFNDCSNLTSITVDSNNPYYDSRNYSNALIETATNTLIIGCTYTVIPNTITVISSHAFSGCKMKKVRIPNSVTTIGERAFSDCDELTDVTIGNSVTSIGASAFNQCYSLKHVTFGNSLTTIGSFAFNNCHRLTSLTIPSTVTSIGDCAFQSCSGLVDLTINSNATINNTVFNGSAFDVARLTIGESVTSFDLSSFAFGTGLSKVTCYAITPPTCNGGFTNYNYNSATLYVPEESISAYENADCWKEFYTITGITNTPVEPQPSGSEMVSIDGFIYQLTYDNSDPMYSGTATMLSRDYYYDSETLDYTEYQIQYEDWNTDSIFYIPYEIVSEFGVFKLTTILRGFGGVSDIKTVVVPSTITTICSYAFVGSSIESITFCGDNSSNDANPLSFGGDIIDPYGYVEHDDGNSVLSGCERLTTVVFEKPITRLPAFTFRNCPKLNSVYFSDRFFDPNTMDLDSIGYCAFYNCDNLTDFNVPNSVKVIAPGAFADCNNLQHINLSDNLTTICDYAFAQCYQLDDITLNPSLECIGEYAFINCWSLSSISIPDGITTIKASCFYDCRNLTSLDLNNVTTFEERAFAGCNKLTVVDLSKAQDIGEAAFFGGEVICSIWCSTDVLGIAVREEGWGTQDTNLGSLKKITLGEDVSFVNERTFVGHIPDTIICMAPTPPIYTRTDNHEWVFSVEAYNATVLCVPQVVVNDYREAYGWKRFAHIEGIAVVGNGDVNSDGELDISDVTALIGVLFGTPTDSSNPINSDVNGDGSIDIDDVTILIGKLLAMQ